MVASAGETARPAKSGKHLLAAWPRRPSVPGPGFDGREAFILAALGGNQWYITIITDLLTPVASGSPVWRG